MRFISFLKDWRNQRTVMRWIVKYTKPALPSLAVLFAFNLAQSLLLLSMALINRAIVDSAVSGGILSGDIAAYIAVMISSIVISAAGTVFTTIINERFAFGIRIRVYDMIMNACWSNVSKYHTGDIITRLSSDVDIVAGGITDTLPSIFSLFASFVVAFAALMYFDPRLAMFALVLGPVISAIGYISGKMIRPLQTKIQESESSYKSFMQESVANSNIYKAFARQRDARERLTGLRNERLHWVMKRQKVGSISHAIMDFTFKSVFLTAFVYSSVQVSLMRITFGTMTVFLSLIGQIQNPIVGLSRTIPRIVSVFASAARLLEIEDMTLEDMSEPSLSEGSPLGLEIKDLRFSYAMDLEPVLENAGAIINAGDFVAITGRSGIGKTTLIWLIMSYISPGRGTIEFIDCKGNRCAVSPGTRKYISYVPQGNTMISGTIASNLRMGDPQITDSEMWRLLEVVSVDRFVKSLPHGLDTWIGERGVGLSEGQAQRLSIARALAKKGSFLVLDEATSALDETTEIAILEHLRQYHQNVTCLLITHRSSVLKYCDKCMIIKDKSLELVFIKGETPE